MENLGSPCHRGKNIDDNNDDNNMNNFVIQIFMNEEDMIELKVAETIVIDVDDDDSGDDSVDDSDDSADGDGDDDVH